MKKWPKSSTSWHMSPNIKIQYNVKQYQFKLSEEIGGLAADHEVPTFVFLTDYLPIIVYS